MGVDGHFSLQPMNKKGCNSLQHTQTFYALFTEIDNVFYIFDQFNFDKFSAKEDTDFNLSVKGIKQKLALSR